jgi:2-polyprenyl-3-methyl-5-hydroxy-6-metoxy-1,4-benzoquinol methylase
MTDKLASPQRMSGQRTEKQSLKRIAKYLLGLERAGRRLNNQFERDDFVIHHLSKIRNGALILDAGCGSQRYRQSCAHLNYRAQDFGQFNVELKKMIASDRVEGDTRYKYGKLDYTGDIWKIEEQSNTFDAILCTEVLEHVPYPNETLREFSRLLKPGGTLILTAPSNCLRHMDPYFFYSGFSDRWFEKLLGDNNFSIEVIEVVGDYYRWLAVELARTATSHSIFAKILLAPAFLYYYNKKKTALSSDTLCMGYQIVARKLQ